MKKREIHMFDVIDSILKQFLGNKIELLYGSVDSHFTYVEKSWQVKILLVLHRLYARPCLS